MTYKQELKALAVKSSVKLSDIHNELNKRHNTNHGYQNFSNRLSNETFKYQEVVEILDILGYDIQWVKRDI